MFIVKNLKKGCVRPVYYLAKQMKSTWGLSQNDMVKRAYQD